MTLMRVPMRASSSSSYFKPSISESMIPTLRLPAGNRLFQNPPQPRRILALMLVLFLELGRIHGQPGHGTPLRIVQFQRPVLHAIGETKGVRAREAFSGGLARARHLRPPPRQKPAPPQRAVHPYARKSAAHELKQPLRTSFNNPVAPLALHFARLP